MNPKSQLLVGALFLTTLLNGFGQPVIISHPTNQVRPVNETATFSVVATGALPLAYQWRFKDADLPGKIASSLRMTNVDLTSAGPYRVVVTDGGGATTSQAAWLSVVPTNVVHLGDRELSFGEPVEMPWETPEPDAAYPYITLDGLTMYFASDRPGGVGQRDLWVSTRPTLSSSWGTPVNLGAPVNTTAIEDDPFLSADGLTLYFDSTRTGGRGSRDLWAATRPSRTEPFGAPVNLGGMINGSAWEMTPSVSRDHLTLLFSSDRNGNDDLWISTRSSLGAPWTAAKSLGRPINSDEYESNPFLSADGLTLHFFSDRHRPGAGSLWVSRRPAVGSPFGPPALIRSISDLSPAGAACPMLSEDEATLYFNTYPDGFPGRIILWRSSITILPQLTAFPPTSIGESQVELFGREGTTYGLETSPDLRVWSPWMTTNTAASIQLIDPLPAGGGPRFYRALSY